MWREIMAHVKTSEVINVRLAEVRIALQAKMAGEYLEQEGITVNGVADASKRCKRACSHCGGAKEKGADTEGWEACLRQNMQRGVDARNLSGGYATYLALRDSGQLG